MPKTRKVKLDRPPIRVTSYGNPGSGKSQFAASCPTPIWVACFDLVGKERPYLKIGHEYDYMDGESDLRVPVTYVYNKAGDMIVQIEHYHDANPDKPVALKRFRRRMQYWTRDEEAFNFNTAVVDSLTFFHLACLNDYVHCNATEREKEVQVDYQRAYGAAKDAMMPILMNRLGTFPINVVVIAHIQLDKDSDGNVTDRGPAAPGALKERLGSGYTEMFRHYVKRSGSDLRYLMQTRPSTRWPHAFSGVCEAPDPCPNSYDALWTNFDS